MAFRKPVTLDILGQKITNTIANLFSGLMFLVIGVFILYLAWTNQLTMHSSFSSFQLEVNLTLALFTRFIGNFTRFIPEPVWALIFVSLLVFIIISALRQFKKGGE